MKYSLLAILVGFTLGNDNQNIQNSYHGRPACRTYNNMMSQVTNNKCNNYDQNAGACLEAFKKVVTDLETSQGSYQYTLHDLLKAQTTCRHETEESNPEALLAALKKVQREEVAQCKQKDLSAQKKHSCKQHPREIKRLEDKIRIRNQNDRSQ